MEDILAQIEHLSLDEQTKLLCVLRERVDRGTQGHQTPHGPQGCLYAYRFPIAVRCLRADEYTEEIHYLVKVGIADPGKLGQRLSSSTSPGEFYMLNKTDLDRPILSFDISSTHLDEALINQLKDPELGDYDISEDLITMEFVDTGREKEYAGYFGWPIGQWGVENPTKSTDCFNDGRWKAKAGWRAWLMSAKPPQTGFKLSLGSGWGEGEFRLMTATSFRKFRDHFRAHGSLFGGSQRLRPPRPAREVREDGSERIQLNLLPPSKAVLYRWPDDHDAKILYPLDEGI